MLENLLFFQFMVLLTAILLFLKQNYFLFTHPKRLRSLNLLHMQAIPISMKSLLFHLLFVARKF